jgi:hypothetical protein
VLNNIRRLLRTPRPERKAAIRRMVQRATGTVVFGWLKGLINRPRSIFVLSYRPDADFAFRTLPDAAMLRRYWIEGNAANNLGDWSRLYAIVLNAMQISRERISGEFAELGVYKGNSARVLCHFAEQDQRRVFLFDTFHGFDERDLQGVDHIKRKQFDDNNLEAVKAFVDSPRAVFVAGRFPESITSEAAQAKYALVHIDCDLYEPAKAAFEFFYPRMAAGGLLIVHDYSSRIWDGIRQALDDFVATIPEQIVLWPDKSGTAVVRKNRGPERTSDSTDIR